MTAPLANQVASRVKVIVRPGYNFANADSALGHGVCDKLVRNRSYGYITGEVKAGIVITNEYRSHTSSLTLPMTAIPLRSGSCTTPRQGVGRHHSDRRKTG